MTKGELRNSVLGILSESYMLRPTFTDDDVFNTVDGIISETDMDDEDGNNICVKKKDLKDIDLSSFKRQDELNPKVWVNGKLNSRVRLRLLDIADAFYDTLEIDWVKPKDIILTGSLANYNWSKYSDFDLHIIVDFSEVSKNRELAKNYFDSKKNDWNSHHSDITIYGFPVELYVQDTEEEHTASGIYSLEKNEWITEPEKNKIKSIKLEKYYIKNKILKYISKICDLEDESLKVSDGYKAECLYEKSKSLMLRIRNMRRASLKKGGEMSVGNIIFKALRRFGYIEKLVNLKWRMFDMMFSIDDGKNTEK